MPYNSHSILNVSRLVSYLKQNEKLDKRNKLEMKIAHGIVTINIPEEFKTPLIPTDLKLESVKLNRN